MKSYNLSQFNILLLHLLALFLGYNVLGAGSGISVYKHYFENPLAQVYYFEDSDTIVALESVTGAVHFSTNSGQSWDKVNQIDSKPSFMLPHPFDKKALFLITNDKKHFITQDAAKTWKSFQVPTKPHSSSSEILSFNSARAGYILYNGEICSEVDDVFGRSKVCNLRVFYTKTSFIPVDSKKPLSAITELFSENRAMKQCSWMKQTADFTASADEAIICVESSANSSTQNPLAGMFGNKVISSDDFFKSENQIILGSDNIDRFILGITSLTRFLVIGAHKKQERDMDIFVSTDGKEWAEGSLQLPKDVFEKSYTVLESTKHSLLVDVKLDTQGGVLYRSNSNGTYFTKSIENTSRSFNGIVDIERISGLEGTLIVNTIARGNLNPFKKKYQSKISFNDGASWNFIQPPSKNIYGKDYGCSSQDIKSGVCSLHLHSVSTTRNPGYIFSVSSAPGVLLGVGSVGSQLSEWNSCDTFLSADGGKSWKAVHEDAHLYEILGSGSSMILVNNEGVTNSFLYSVDSGETWKTEELGLDFVAKSTTTQTNGASNSVLIMGTTSGSKKDKKNVVINVDLRYWDNKCSFDPNDLKENSDIETWSQFDTFKECIMGHKSTYFRRRAKAQCFMPNLKPLSPNIEPCECTKLDYECDYNYALNGSNECSLASDQVIPKNTCKPGQKNYFGSSGYRKIPGNTCTLPQGKSGIDEPVQRPCPENHTPNSPEDFPNSEHNIKHSEFSFSGVSNLLSFNNSNTVLVLSKPDILYRSANGGGSWEEVKLDNISNKKFRPVLVIPNTYVDGKAYLYSQNNELAYTDDFGNSWKLIKSPPSPANQLQLFPLLEFHSKNPNYLLFAGGTECPKCFTKYFVSHNHGDTWSLLTTHAEKCQFARTGGFEGLDDDSVVCVSWSDKEGTQNSQDGLRLNRGKNFLQIVSFDSKKPSSKKILPMGKNGNAVNFFIYSKYLVYSADVEGIDENANKVTNAELWVINGKSDPVKPSFPPNMPVGLRPNGFTLLQSNSGELLMDVEQSPSASKSPILSWGTLLACNDNGTAFDVILERTNRNSMGNVDVEVVEGIKGAIIANQIINTDVIGRVGVRKELKTIYSLDGGRSWSTFSPPVGPSESASSCSGCVLNLQGRTGTKASGSIYGTKSAPGLWMGLGFVGTSMETDTPNSVFLSRDAGHSWTKIFSGSMLYEWGDYGGIILLVSNSSPTNIAYFSIDSGKTFSKYKFSSDSVLVKLLMNGLDSSGMQFLLIGATNNGAVKVFQIDFSQANLPQCSKDLTIGQMEKWTLLENKKSETNQANSEFAELCFLGEKTSYLRRKLGASCYIGNTDSSKNLGTSSSLANDLTNPQISTCECNYSDYYCDIGFWFDSADRCELFGRDEFEPSGCAAGSKYSGRSGYVKKSISRCNGGTDLSKPVDRICGKGGGTMVHSSVWPGEKADLLYFPESFFVMAITKTSKLLISANFGESWNEKDFGHPVAGMILNPFFKNVAVVLTNSKEHYITTDKAENFQKILLPAAPNISYLPIIRFHPTNVLTMIYMGISEACQKNNVPPSKKCYATPYYTTNGGQTWEKINSSVGHGGCVFLHEQNQGTSSNRVICAIRDSSLPDSISTSKVISSGDWFNSDKTVLSDRAIDFVFTGKFIVMAEQHELTKRKLQLRISIDAKTTSLAHFPGNTHEVSHSFTVLDLEKHFDFLVLFVTENQNNGVEWGTVYTSNSNGTYFHRSLEQANRDTRGLVDFERCAGINGTIIANIVSNYKSLKVIKPSTNRLLRKSPEFDISGLLSTKKQAKELRTVITIDGGSSWRYLKPPALDSKGKAYSCVSKGHEQGKCSLQLHGFSELPDPQNIYSASGAVGIVMGLGNVGDKLSSLDGSSLFLSRDGGYIWTEVRKGPHFYEFADHGAILVIADMKKPVDFVEYSLDAGATWNKITLQLPPSIPASNKIIISTLTTEPTSSTRDLLLLGQVKSGESNSGPQVDIVINLDFTEVQPRQCLFDPLDEPSGRNQDDFELWSVEANRGKVAFGSPDTSRANCVLGAHVKYFRKIPSKKCFVGKDFVQQPKVVEYCPCTLADFECDYNFVASGKDGACQLVNGLKPIQSTCEIGNTYYNISSGYRIIPHSQCNRAHKDSLRLDSPVEVWCPGEAQRVALIWTFLLPLIFFLLAIFVFLLVSNPGSSAKDVFTTGGNLLALSTIKIFDAVRNVGVFQQQYRHMLPKTNHETGDTENDEYQQMLRLAGPRSQNQHRWDSSRNSSPLQSAWEVTKGSFMVSCGVLVDATRESIIFGSNFLPVRYRSYIQSIAPLGPIAFPGDRTSVTTQSLDNPGYDFTRLNDFDSDFDFDPDEMFKHDNSDDSEEESDLIFNDHDLAQSSKNGTE